jgi:hypothetical protein
VTSRGRLRRTERRPWQYSLAALFVLTTVCAVALKAAIALPFEGLIIAGIVALCLLAVTMYVGVLVVIGWAIDIPIWLAERAMPPAYVPLEIEHVGEITVVTLSDNIASARECRSVRQQLDRLIAEHHCDLLIDFSSIKKLNSGFREVLIIVTKAARKEAEKQGLPYREFELPAGEIFPIYENRERALAEMTRHKGRGRVVLCAVPVSIRAVSGTK